jgi:predicted O-linked N-acetylglucosamine transferase (SPINDLY family)
MGESFAGRVAASLLHALDLPELVMATLEAYEARAVDLARDAQALRAVRDKLAGSLRNAPLFDGGRFARHLEAAFRAMHARHVAGLSPDHMEMVPVPVP